MQKLACIDELAKGDMLCGVVALAMSSDSEGIFQVNAAPVRFEAMPPPAAAAVAAADIAAGRVDIFLLLLSSPPVVGCATERC
jgi:hypothetical protein